MDLSHFTQQLADMHVSTIVWAVVVLTVVRLAFARVPNVLARAIVEIAEAALFAAVLVFLIIQPFMVKAFYIPSGSMMPTLIDYDHILVNKLAYRFEPKQHGDIVVFTAPAQALKISPEASSNDSGDPTDYIKRLIGLPGDVITVTGGTITVGNRTYTHGDVRHVYSLDDPDKQHVKFTKTGVEIYDGVWVFHPAEEVAEKLTGLAGQRVTINPGVVKRNGTALVEPYIAEDADYDMKVVHGDVVLRDADPGVGIKINGEDVPDKEVLVKLKAPPGPIPAGDILVMGDNRNDSNDGTRWGPLDEHNIVGRAFLIFYPFARMRILH